MQPLTPEEQVEVFRVAKNFQDNPQKVYRLIKEIVGMDRVQLAIDYLRTLAQ